MILFFFNPKLLKTFEWLDFCMFVYTETFTKDLLITSEHLSGHFARECNTICPVNEALTEVWWCKRETNQSTGVNQKQNGFHRRKYAIKWSSWPQLDSHQTSQQYCWIDTIFEEKWCEIPLDHRADLMCNYRKCLMEVIAAKGRSMRSNGSHTFSTLHCEFVYCLCLLCICLFLWCNLGPFYP